MLAAVRAGPDGALTVSPARVVPGVLGRRVAALARAIVDAVPVGVAVDRRSAPRLRRSPACAVRRPRHESHHRASGSWRFRKRRDPSPPARCSHPARLHRSASGRVIRAGSPAPRAGCGTSCTRSRTAKRRPGSGAVQVHVRLRDGERGGGMVTGRTEHCRRPPVGARPRLHPGRGGRPGLRVGTARFRTASPA